MYNEVITTYYNTNCIHHLNLGKLGVKKKIFYIPLIEYDIFVIGYG